MSEVETIETPVPEVVPVQEFTYEYQPTDENGHPLGAKQVFKGATAQEVLDKVAEANKNLIKLNRQLNKNIRLGKFEKEEIPEDAVRFASTNSSEPRQLTPEERYQISRDMLDPEKVDTAFDLLFETKFGQKPTEFVSQAQRTQQDLEQMRAKAEAELFVRNNPDYYGCKENFETITNWMLKNDLTPTHRNFQLAYNKLKEVGLLLEAPIVREEPQTTPVAPEPVVEVTPPNTQVVTDEPSRITSESHSQAKRPPVVATGLTRDDATPSTPVVKSSKLTVAEIEKIPGDVYKKRLLTEKGFKEAVDEAYAQASRKG